MNKPFMQDSIGRREFLQAAISGVSMAACAFREREEGMGRNVKRVITVTGPVAPEELGFTLPHEHLLVDFIGADQVSPNRYIADKVLAKVLLYLIEARSAGVQTLVDCTPAWLGRDVLLLKNLSEASGVQILTCTGYYGAAGDKYLPPHAFHESAEQLAERWLKECREGIEGQPVRPGLIKIGVDDAPLSEVDRKLVRAAAFTHQASGLTIASHTPSGAAALEQLDLLEALGVSAEGFIWVHAQAESNAEIHVQAANRGAWVEYDGIGPNSIEKHLQWVQGMKSKGLLNRVLLSHDAGWYHVGEPDGGEFRPFTTLHTTFIPELTVAGFSKSEIDLLTRSNPQRAFAIHEQPGR